MIQKRSIGIVGTGHVGVAAAYAVFLRGLCSEIVLIDKDSRRAEGEAMDLMHGQAFAERVTARAGNYEDLADAQLVVISAGVAQKEGETRLDLLNRNADVFRDIISRKGYTNTAIGSAIARLVEAVLEDQGSVLPVGRLLEGHYDIAEICLSIPTIVGSSGIREALLPRLNEEERRGLHRSADILKESLRQLGIGIIFAGDRSRVLVGKSGPWIHERVDQQSSGGKKRRLSRHNTAQSIIRYRLGRMVAPTNNGLV